MLDPKLPKVCPIFIAGSNNFVGRCIGEDCGWWLTFAEDCAIPVIAGVLADSTICTNVFKPMEEVDDEYIRD